MSMSPVFIRRGWTSIPADLFRAISGNSFLPVYECDKAKVQVPRARLRPLDQPQSQLRFSAWRLAHAIKKADWARTPNPLSLQMGTVGFLLEQTYLFDWGQKELRLSAGMSDCYADSTRSSLSGRLGQGIALLLLESQGYAYVGRLATELIQYSGRNAARALIKKKNRRSARRIRSRIPDFLVENVQGERALAEAKGGFVTPGQNPGIKENLRDALEQLSGWDQILEPQPVKNFAIASFLRENEDLSEEPSLIAFVDPEPGEPNRPVELPPDAIRRANYASWLSLMGFDNAANRLRARRGDRQHRTVPVVTLGNHRYVIAVTSIRPWTRRILTGADLWWLVRHGPDWPFSEFVDGAVLEVTGLELTVFQAISDALLHKSLEASPIKPTTAADTSMELDGGVFYGSSFLDGSLLGEIRTSRMGGTHIEPFEVEL